MGQKDEPPLLSVLEARSAAFPCDNVRGVRVLIDYRAALRDRTGVGEYTHELAKALLAAFSSPQSNGALDLTIFSSSWKDRLSRTPELAGATLVDRRVPVRLLNLAWHRLAWPPVETLTGRNFDVTHSLHPLRLPSRTAAHVVTIHDLYFLDHPERTRAEIRRDYPRLARTHAHQADRIVVPSRFTAREVERRLEVPAERIAVCSPGAPRWPPHETPPDGYILFFGTLEPRKNVAGLLDAYERLIAEGPAEERPADAEHDRPRGSARNGCLSRGRIPELVLAGKATKAAGSWLDRIARPPLVGRVRHIGYVDPVERHALYAAARLLVQPSFEEGFGMPVLEAMAAGVPVVASDRGSLPEVLGDAGPLVNPDKPADLAAAISRLLSDGPYAADCRARGLLRARRFSWERTARLVYHAYEQAIEHRRCASA